MVAFARLYCNQLDIGEEGWVLRSTVAWLLGVILCLGAVFVVMVPLGGIRTISKQFAVQDDQYFLVENAVAAEPVFHDWLRRNVPEGEQFEPGSERVHRVHRIASGGGTVIGWRYAYDEFLTIDEEHSFKLTLFLPGPVPQGESVITLGPGEGQPYAVDTRESMWSSCMGIARKGTVRLLHDDRDRITAEFDIVVERIADNDALRPKKACPTAGFRTEVRLKLVEFEDLTPWQGRAEGNVGRGEWRPEFLE